MRLFEADSLKSEQRFSVRAAPNNKIARILQIFNAFRNFDRFGNGSRHNNWHNLQVPLVCVGEVLEEPQAAQINLWRVEVRRMKNSPAFPIGHAAIAAVGRR
jgi:hypothetical protein